LSQEEQRWRLKRWRLKSQAILIKEGDNNTKFFHDAAKYKNNINSIWEIQARDGTIVRSFDEKAYEAVQYFSSLFQEPLGFPIQ